MKKYGSRKHSQNTKSKIRLKKIDETRNKPK